MPPMYKTGFSRLLQPATKIAVVIAKTKAQTILKLNIFMMESSPKLDSSGNRVWFELSGWEDTNAHELD